MFKIFINDNLMQIVLFPMWFIALALVLLFHFKAPTADAQLNRIFYGHPAQNVAKVSPNFVK